jgi:hypothetical protein
MSETSPDTPTRGIDGVPGRCGGGDGDAGLVGHRELLFSIVHNMLGSVAGPRRGDLHQRHARRTTRRPTLIRSSSLKILIHRS